MAGIAGAEDLHWIQVGKLITMLRGLNPNLYVEPNGLSNLAILEPMEGVDAETEQDPGTFVFIGWIDILAEEINWVIDTDVEEPLPR